MGREIPKNPEIIAHLNEFRKKSDLSMVEGGAKLELTPEQIGDAAKEMNNEKRRKEYEKALEVYVQTLSLTLDKARSLKQMFQIYEEKIDASLLPVATETLDSENILENKMKDINDKISFIIEELSKQGLT